MRLASPLRVICLGLRYLLIYWMLCLRECRRRLWSPCVS
ncbi:unnamed protein product [Arabidopsis halleri]